MLRHLSLLEDALAAVLGAEEVECSHCGCSGLDLTAGEVPDLADRLLAVVTAIQTRMDARHGYRSPAWERSSPDRCPGERRSRNTAADDGGAQ